MSLEWHNHMSVFNFSLRNAKSVSKNSRLCERHALENSKPSYWAIKMINLLERNPLWRRHIPFWHCATWEVLFFPPTALPTTAQVQPVSQIWARVSLPAERALRDRVFAQCGFLRSASTKARLAALFHWNHFFPFNSFLFSESICYGFSSAAYLWPHANFHKRAFFVLNRMQWCLPLPSKRAVWIRSQVQKREDGGEKGESSSSM